MLITLPARALKELSALKAINDFGAAYALAARLLNHEALQQTFDRINAEHARKGSLDACLDGERHYAYQSLMAYAKARMAPADYQRFYMCF